ncbi:Putative cytochrome C-type biogenesis protein [hydrothermal vent metagenome]|uniref:Cytochrome C-type biogenesis protein n=1 Tax=hydrothermal vent metagenome TaxID=652676 RepID=A0A3B1DYE8_9ZZZZ
MFKRLILTLFFLSLGIQSVYAQQPLCPLERTTKPKKVTSFDVLKEFPVLHQGRIKPLDTYARHLLLQLSGRKSYDRTPAIEWLAALIFSPETTWDDKVFLINNPQVPMALGIEPEKKRRYTFNQLSPNLNKLTELARVVDKIEQNERSITEREILRVYRNTILFLQHTHLSSFAFPHQNFQVSDSEIINQLKLPKQNGYSFLDIALTANLIQAATENLDMNAVEGWSYKEKSLFQLLDNLYQWSMYYQELPFHVIPTVSDQDEVWLSPWDAMNNEFYEGVIRKELDLWRNVIVGYWNADQSLFDSSIRTLQVSMNSRVNKKERKAISKISTEVFYNKGNFLLWAKLLYGTAFLLFLLSLFLSKSFLYWPSLLLVIAGFIPHITVLVLRIIILSRPPVANLFDTFFFVALIGVLIGLIVEMRNKQGIGIAVASLCGLVFLLISGKYAAEGDTLQVLVAVLNSNFWLATHVITISIGYAGCYIATFIGHIYIIQTCVGKIGKKALESTYRNLMGTLNFGLFMTFFGTILGGIWADQSWGRFWGWDPKENGALLIVLWSALIIHAKIGRLIGPYGLAVGTVLGGIVVMWAWLGVNLLNVGLHSYGFTSGIAHSLYAYVLFEILFLGAAAFVRHKRLKVGV